MRYVPRRQASMNRPAAGCSFPLLMEMHDGIETCVIVELAGDDRAVQASLGSSATSLKAQPKFRDSPRSPANGDAARGRLEAAPQIISAFCRCQYHHMNYANSAQTSQGTRKITVVS